MLLGLFEAVSEVRKRSEATTATNAIDETNGENFWEYGCEERSDARRLLVTCGQRYASLEIL